MPAIIVANGPQLGVFLVLGKAPIVLGRDQASNLQLEDVQASRRHIQIRVGGDGLYRVTDMKSSNGTMLNGGKLEEEQTLADGDEIVVGETHLRFTADVPVSGANALELLKKAGERHRSTLVR